MLYLLKNSGKDLFDAIAIGGFSKVKREQYDKDMPNE